MAFEEVSNWPAIGQLIQDLSDELEVSDVSKEAPSGEELLSILSSSRDQVDKCLGQMFSSEPPRQNEMKARIFKAAVDLFVLRARLEN